MTSPDKDNLASALASLISEESEIAKQIQALTTRLMRVQAARKELEGVAGGELETYSLNYSNLTARNAIRMYLKEQGKPLAAPDIAHGLIERGFKSKARSFVNMVGVTLRNYEGADFKRASENRWTLV